MNCPVDGYPMTAHVNNVTLRVESCPQCRGVWTTHSKMVAFKALHQLFAGVEGLSSTLRAFDPMVLPPRSVRTQVLVCPVCHTDLNVRQADEESIDVCMKCGGAWVDAHELDRFLLVDSVLPHSNPEPVAEVASDEERFDRFSFKSKRVHAAAFPIATVVALTLNDSAFVGVLTPFHIWIHEFGHAIPAWLAGYRAAPLPFGWTSIEPERSIVVYIAILFLLSVLFWTGWKKKLWGAMVLATGLAIAQFSVTWTVHPEIIDRWIYFSGVGGEFYVSAFLMIAFYFQMPDRFRWDFWRYVVLVIAASAFFDNFTLWHQIEEGNAGIPWGTLFGGEGDDYGDMNSLKFQYGWPNERIVGTYVWLGNACLAALIAVYVLFLLKPNATVTVRRSLGFAKPVSN